jgi:ribosomal protein L9
MRTRLPKNVLQLKIWRNVESSTGTDFNTIKPGMVDAKAIRRKINKQLKIRLELHERVHVNKEQINYDEVTNKELAELVLNDTLFGCTDRERACTNQIKTLGQYVARICLRAGFIIPLKFEVLKR